MNSFSPDDAACDHFLDGKIVLHQPRSGYRFSVDAAILAHQAAPQQGDRIVDLGTGCGVISVLLAFRHPHIRLIGVEIQDALAQMALKNVAENKMADRIRILAKDMLDLTLADIDGPADVVVSNPPYRKLDSGRLNADAQRAVARHELKITLGQLVDTARRLLRKTGKAVVIYPSVRTIDLLATMRSSGIEPKTLTMIHSTRSSPARLVTVTGIKGGRPGLEVTAPIHLYRDDGSYTRQAQRMFSP